MTSIRLAVLRCAKLLGLFAAARLLTARRLRILCYHGVAIVDEHLFRPGLFMRAETFTRRLRHIAEMEYPVLPLAEAVERLQRGTLPRCATVITIDDGWYGTYSVMGPALESFGFPATLYVSSYYLDKGTQVFNVALGYILWKTSSPSLDLTGIAPQLAGRYEITIPAQRQRAERTIRAYADALPTAAERQALLRSLCDRLNIDWREIEEKRMFAFMSRDEAAELLEARIDLQLHTHRHRFPAADPEALRKEIEDNRRSLGAVTAEPLTHLCYPSGEYERDSFPLLESLGIRTATTTVRGLNTAETPPFELRRLLDSDATPDIIFEAEMSGFLELCRLAFGGAARARSRATRT